MIHTIEIDECDAEFVEDLLDLADMEYTREREISKLIYSIEGKTAKVRTIIKFMRKQSIRFYSDFGDYWDF